MAYNDKGSDRGRQKGGYTYRAKFSAPGAQGGEKAGGGEGYKGKNKGPGQERQKPYGTEGYKGKGQTGGKGRYQGPAQDRQKPYDPVDSRETLRQDGYRGKGRYKGPGQEQKPTYGPVDAPEASRPEGYRSKGRYKGPVQEPKPAYNAVEAYETSRPEGSRPEGPEGYRSKGRYKGPVQEPKPTYTTAGACEVPPPEGVMGRNPVKEALKSGRSIERILVQKEPDGSLRELIAMAKDRGVPVREVERSKLDELCMPFGHGDKTGNHQGIFAQTAGIQYCEIGDILAVAAQRGEPPFVVLLDGVEDPYNLGSILRSAECAGAHGVIIPKRRAAGVTAAACKASAGASEYIKVAQVSNLCGAMDRLKEAGLWIFGADMAGTPMTEADLKEAVGLVIGGEGKGLSRLVKEHCDMLLSIPLRGQINSLNASVAAAVLLYEKVRQTTLKKA